MKTFPCLMIVLVTACTPTVGSADDDFSAGPADDVPQLKVLDRLRGQWTGTVGDGDGELKLTHRWILDGHVLESKIDVGPNMSALLLRTYDAADEQYVATYMDNEGSVVVMTGQWDEDQQTLSTSGKNDAKVITLTTRFVDEQTAQWAITETDGANETSRIGGTNRRLRR